MAGRVRRVLFDTNMLARLWARGAVPGLRRVRTADETVRRTDLSARAPATSRGLLLRVASGVVLVPFLLGVAYVGQPVYGALITLACAYAAFEVRGMLRTGGYAAVPLVLFGVAIGLPLDAWLRPPVDTASPAPDGLAIVLLA